MELPAYLMNASNIYVLKIDHEGKIIFSNNYFRQNFSNTNYFNELLSAEELPYFLKVLDDCITWKKTNILVDLTLKKWMGGPVKIKWEFTPEKNDHDLKKEVIGIGYNINANDQQRDILESEKKYHSLFEQASDPIMLTDFNGNFIDVNMSMCYLFGYSKEELLGLSIQALIDKEQLKESPIRFDLLAEGQHIFSHRKMVHRNGNIIHVEANVKRFGEGMIMAIARDVTELKKAEENLIVQEKQLRLFVQHSPAAIAMFDTDMRYINVSNRWLTEYKLTGEQLIGRLHYDVFPWIPQRWRDVHSRCLAGATEKSEDDSFTNNDGSVDWLRWEVHPWYKASGEIGGIIMLTEVITERKKIAEENEHIRYMLNERVKELTTLYRFSQILQTGQPNMEELLQELVSVLPAGWQYPEITAAKIIFGMSEFKTPNFTSGPHKQQVSFQTPEGTNVAIEIIYLEQKPDEEEGAFLAEERHLINMLAEMFRIFLARKEESEALKKSEANLHTIFDTTDTVYVLLDKKFRVISYNKPAADFTVKELGHSIRMNDHFIDYFPSERRTVLLKHMKKALAGDTVNYESWYPQPDGATNWYDVRILDIAGSEGEVFGIVLAVLDITEKKLLEAEILEQKIQEQKKISRAIIKTQERERNHIGQELHDNVNQILAGTKLYLKIAAKNNETVEELIRYPMELIDSSIHEIRLLSSKQVTPLKNIQLKDLIQLLLDDLERDTKLKPVLNYNVDDHSIDDDLKLNIYRIMQEQVTNITKYAAARHVHISILADNDSISMSVSDDGVGFNVNKKRKGIGISNMINRVEAFNGEVIIDSSPGNGTTIQIKIPLSDSRLH